MDQGAQGTDGALVVAIQELRFLGGGVQARRRFPAARHHRIVRESIFRPDANIRGTGCEQEGIFRCKPEIRELCFGQPSLLCRQNLLQGSNNPVCGCLSPIFELLRFKRAILLHQAHTHPYKCDHGDRGDGQEQNCHVTGGMFPRTERVHFDTIPSLRFF